MGVHAALLLSSLISTQLVDAARLGDDPIATSLGILIVEDNSVDMRKEESTKDGHGNYAHDAKVGASEEELGPFGKKKTEEAPKNRAAEEETAEEGVQNKDNCVYCGNMERASTEAKEEAGKAFANCNKLKDFQSDPSKCEDYFNLFIVDGKVVKKQCQHDMPKMSGQECRPNEMCCDEPGDDPQAAWDAKKAERKAEKDAENAGDMSS